MQVFFCAVIRGAREVIGRSLFVLGVEILDEGDAQLLAEILELIEVLVVLLLVLNFGLDAYLTGLG
jgi:hypothetical protein